MTSRHWFDFEVSDKPVPIAGRVLVDANYAPWDVIRTEPQDAVTWLLQVKSVKRFLATLPPDMQPATPARPLSGLPKNVWVGGHLEEVWPELLDVRARVRFLIVDERTDPNLLKNALDAWRCSNCGRRGQSPRPQHCPHAAHLCGDASLLPQVHWIIDLNNSTTWKQQGVAYWPEGAPSV